MCWQIIRYTTTALTPYPTHRSGCVRRETGRGDLPASAASLLDDMICDDQARFVNIEHLTALLADHRCIAKISRTTPTTLGLVANGAVSATARQCRTRRPRLLAPCTRHTTSIGEGLLAGLTFGHASLATITPISRRRQRRIPRILRLEPGFQLDDPRQQRLDPGHQLDIRRGQLDVQRLQRSDSGLQQHSPTIPLPTASNHGIHTLTTRNTRPPECLRPVVDVARDLKLHEGTLSN